MYKTKIKINKPFVAIEDQENGPGFRKMKADTEVYIPCDKDGKPTSKFWRARVRDAEKDGLITVIEGPEKDKEAAKEAKKKDSTKENKAEKETK